MLASPAAPSRPSPSLAGESKDDIPYVESMSSILTEMAPDVAEAVTQTLADDDRAAAEYDIDEMPSISTETATKEDDVATDVKVVPSITLEKPPAEASTNGEVKADSSFPDIMINEKGSVVSKLASKSQTEDEHSFPEFMKISTKKLLGHLSELTSSGVNCTNLCADDEARDDDVQVLYSYSESIDNMVSFETHDDDGRESIEVDGGVDVMKIVMGNLSKVYDSAVKAATGTNVVEKQVPTVSTNGAKGADFTSLIDVNKIGGDTQKALAAVQYLTMFNLSKGCGAAEKGFIASVDLLLDGTDPNNCSKPVEAIEVKRCVEEDALPVKTGAGASKKSKVPKLRSFVSKKKLSAPTMTDMRLTMAKKSAEAQICLLKPLL